MSLKLDKDREKDKFNQERYQIILNSLLKEEENKYCADCDAKGPRWASWNLGVFLCIRCAGIHRNLGCHVSRIKSINLDTWKAEQLQLLQEIGNSRARAIYEASVPETFRRPQNDSALESFIRAKYEHKKYIAKEWVPPSQAYLKAKAKDLEDGIEREIKDKKKKRVNANSASAGLGKIGTIQDQALKVSHSDQNSQALFGFGKEVTLIKNISPIDCPLSTSNHTQQQSHDLLLQLDQPSPRSTLARNKIDEFNDFLFASVPEQQIGGDNNNSTNNFYTKNAPLEIFQLGDSVPATANNNHNSDNTSILASVLGAEIPTSGLGPSSGFGTANLLGNTNLTNVNSKEAILALYGNSLTPAQNLQGINMNHPNHNPSRAKEYVPFVAPSNANKFQNTQFQQDYLKQVQNQLASLAVNDTTNNKPTFQHNSLI